MNHCPKSGQICIDDLCRSCGNCILTGDDMLEKCHKCGQLTGRDFDCACEPEYEFLEEPYDNDE